MWRNPPACAAGCCTDAGRTLADGKGRHLLAVAERDGPRPQLLPDVFAQAKLAAASVPESEDRARNLRDPSRCDAHVVVEVLLRCARSLCIHVRPYAHPVQQQELDWGSIAVPCCARGAGRGPRVPRRVSWSSWRGGEWPQPRPWQQPPPPPCASPPPVLSAWVPL